jgi:hypothetical protein
MHRYQYFVKRVQVPYTWSRKFQCIRLPEGDKRIPELTDLYKRFGWCVFVPYQFKPTEADEIFQLKKYFRTWDDDFEIMDPDEKPKEMF